MKLLLLFTFLFYLTLSFSFTEEQKRLIINEPRKFFEFEKSIYTEIFEKKSALKQLESNNSIDFNKIENLIEPQLTQINTEISKLFSGRVSIKTQGDIKYKLSLIKEWGINLFYLSKLNKDFNGIIVSNAINNNYIYVNQGYFQFEKQRNGILMTWGAGPCVILIIKGKLGGVNIYGLAHLDSDSDEYMKENYLSTLLRNNFDNIEMAFLISSNISEESTIISTINMLRTLIPNNIKHFIINKDVVDAGVNLTNGQIYLLNPYRNPKYQIDYTPNILLSEQLKVNEPSFFLDKNRGTCVVFQNSKYIGKYKTYEIYRNQSISNSIKEIGLCGDMKKLIDERNK